MSLKKSLKSYGKWLGREVLNTAGDIVTYAATSAVKAVVGSILPSSGNSDDHVEPSEAKTYGKTKAEKYGEMSDQQLSREAQRIRNSDHASRNAQDTIAVAQELKNRGMVKKDN